MKRCSFVINLVVLFGFSTLSFGDFAYDAFKDGVGARPQSMGNAYTALGEEAGSLSFNPAGLGIPGGFMAVENLDMNEDVYRTYSHYMVYKAPFGYSQWAKEDQTGNRVEVSSYGYGRLGRNGVDWGVSYKNLEVSGDRNFSGWSSDFGLLVRFSPQVHYGLVFHDIAKSKDVEIPGTVATGFSFLTKQKHFILSGDVVQDRSDLENEFFYTRAGAEWNISDGLVLRGGISRTDLSGGISFLFPVLDLSFGLVSDTTDTTPTRFFWSAKLGKGTLPYRLRRKYSLFKRNAYAYFKVDSSLIEGKSVVSFYGGQKVGSNDLITLINRANKDKSIKGYKIRIGSISSSISSVGLIQEIRKELQKGKDAGKEVIVYIEGWATMPEYYLASVADKIVMPELGTISHLGLDLEILKTERFLNNFGIDNQVISSGRYKDALDPVSDSLDESDRLVLEELVSDLYHQVLFDIKDSRGLDWNQIGSLSDGRLITAREAKELGLIDELAYWSGYSQREIRDPDVVQLTEVSQDIASPSLSTIPLTDFVEEEQPVSLFSPFNRIAIVEVDGFIKQGRNQQDFLYGQKGTGSDSISHILDQISRDVTIKGVILRVNSPGGSMIASDHIYSEIKRFRAKSNKPVYTSMGNIAASGGYYVSLGTERIFANPGTLTGSIGVVSSYQNVEGLHSMLGIERDVIKTGRYMDMLSPNREINEEELDILQNFQEKMYNVFVDRVAENRDISNEEAYEIAQGQLLTGEQAKSLKLVDDLGNFYDAVDKLAEKTKITNPVLVFFREKTPLFSFMR